MAVHNTVRRVNRAGGLVGLFRTRRQNVEDEIVKLNVDGYEVTFILEDRWTLLQTLGSLLLLIVTALIYTKSPGYLILAVKRA